MNKNLFGFLQDKKNRRETAPVSSGPLTMDSTLREINATPVGHDIMARILLQLRLKEKILNKGPLAEMKLSSLEKLQGVNMDQDLFKTILNIVNNGRGIQVSEGGKIAPAWWKEAVFYQIYPRSFADSNGDGIGDIPGIISKLDYLKDLGVNALWLSPVYDSPLDDNGYDIRDYRGILKEFGTMEDMDRLLEEVHKRDMRLIMDLVVNHTSDEHPFFREALKDPESKYRDYYFFRDSEDGKNPPNNWKSFFSGPAWNYYPEQKTWALHVFSSKQMDLNWDNEAVRDDVIDMINWWLDKGVDGFRMDVINYISKTPGLPDGSKTVGDLIGYTGVEQYFYGPRLHEYLHEIHERAFGPHKAFSVGEMPGLGMEMSRRVTAEEREELDMVFNFDHLETPGHMKFDDYRYDLNYYRDYITDWMLHYGNNCWMSLFYNNHDNPRMVSKINPDPAYRKAVEVLLAVMQFTLKGTPFVYQGDEMGLVNYPFANMSEISDVESVNLYKELIRKETAESAFAKILTGTRDHARVLLPWNKHPEDRPERMIQKEDKQITEIYRELIRLRRDNPTLIYGDFTAVNTSKDRFIYKRSLKYTDFCIECNLSDKPKKALFDEKGWELIFPDKINTQRIGTLPPYGARIWRKVYDFGI